jgi:Tol biopolymer transport system component/LysM repeat protein
MQFLEAEEQYRDLEARLLRGELTEDDFAARAAQLRVVDKDGRRWMISVRTGRWLLFDGQGWVFAEPPRETAEPEKETEAPTLIVEQTKQGEPGPAATKEDLRRQAPAPGRERRLAVPRLMATGIVSVILVLCVIGGGIAAWVLWLRDMGAESTPLPTEVAVIAPVATYTSRPATPTYTATWTPTPSRTPIPTDTPLPTETPISTNTPTFTPTPTEVPPSATPSSPASTSTVVALVTDTPDSTSAASSSQTYVVKQGETLSEIAVRFGVSLQELADANGISNPALIRAGQVLVIPTPGPVATPTWTAIALATPRATATNTTRPTATTSAASATPSRTATTAPSPTPTERGPTPTPKPTNTPKPVPTPTPKPLALSGKIAFSVWDPYGAKYDLYVSRIDGTGRNMLGEGFRQPQFRQDGNLLAVNGEGAPNYEHLVTIDASGGGRVEVSNYAEDSYPTWSPDGAIVAYSSSSWGDGETRLGIVHDMFGKNQDWIKIGTTEIRGEYPFWMSDGRVVYHGCDFMAGGGNCGLYWVGAGGGNFHRLTTEQSDTAPAGTGSRVAFMSARDGNWEVYSIDMDGGGLERLTSNNAIDGLPTWSPDHKSIAFVSNRSGAWAIWVMNANGSNQRKLFDLGGGYGSGASDWTTERITWAP